MTRPDLLEKWLNKKWLMIAVYGISAASALLSIYVFLRGGEFLRILETFY
jgi:hypothetical protein